MIVTTPSRSMRSHWLGAKTPGALGVGEEAVQQRQPEPDDEPGADGEPALEQRAAARPRVRGHHAPPRASAAARWMAARIRWYVPQRQMFPAMAASMSSSVGFVFWARRAAADMSWPDWQ